MRSSFAPNALLAAVFVVAALPAFSQVAPAATEGGLEGRLPLVVGAGASTFDIDWGNDAGTIRTMNGPTVWVDWNFYHARGLMSGIGIEIEGHDIAHDRPRSLSSSALHDSGTNMRQDTGEGGLIYTWRHF